MDIFKRRENKKQLIIPSEKIICDNCNLPLEIKEKDITSEIHHVLIFPIRTEYVICPVCNNKIYRIPRNFWTRDLGFGNDL